MFPCGHLSVTVARNIEILLFAFGQAIEISVVIHATMSNLHSHPALPLVFNTKYASKVI